MKKLLMILMFIGMIAACTTKATKVPTTDSIAVVDSTVADTVIVDSTSVDSVW